jgi:hypothetical protein
MTIATHPVFELLIQLWSLPAGDRHPASLPAGYVRDSRVAPEVVLEATLAEFPWTDVREELIRFLDEAIGVFDRGGKLDRRESFLVGCCLTLLNVPANWDLPESLLAGVIRALPLAAFLKEIGELISRNMNRSAVFESLLRGLSGNYPNLLNCLEGLYYYPNRAQPDPDRARSATVIARVASRLKELETSSDGLVRKSVEDAEKALQRYAAQ